MIKIHPIMAIRPDLKTLEVLLSKLAGDQMPSPAGQNELKMAPNPLHTDSTSAFYLYEFKKGELLKTAVWALTDLSSTPESVIKGHEQTLCHKVESIKNDRKDRLWEKSPVVMVHRPIAALEEAIHQIKLSHRPVEHPWESLGHTIWKVSMPEHIAWIKSCIQKLDEIFVADGHHRLAAAYQDEGEDTQKISTLFVPWDSITISPFHRLLNLGQQAASLNNLLQKLAPYYYVSLVPNNVPYRPDRKNRVGMYFQSTWYQLDSKQNDGTLACRSDAESLQRQILGPVLGIIDPQTDQRLVNVPDKDWTKMIAEIYENSGLIAFTLYQMDTSDFISHAQKGMFLPPKTTYIEPKVPPGMMMNALLPVHEYVEKPSL